MTATALPLGPNGLAGLAKPATLSQECVVRLIDRRTGHGHRVNGSLLVLFTTTPEAAAEQLFSGRDSTVWEARVEPIGTDLRKDGGRK